MIFRNIKKLDAITTTKNLFILSKKRIKKKS